MSVEISHGIDDRIARAQRAFEEYYAQCFWYMKRELRVCEHDLERIAEGLRKHGDRRAFVLADEICH